MDVIYFYPRPPRGGRPFPPPSGMSAKRISIHALREEGDLPSAAARPFHQDFYPRPPRGGRHNAEGAVLDRYGFLSTPSARRATYPRALAASVAQFLSTPSARRATRSNCTCMSGGQFLSTPSARRATHVAMQAKLAKLISCLLYTSRCV